ncbi:beta-N-acetylglucosaminidase domain-containing protein [Kitasatospora sp. NPDC096147]|uniref:beta-N-acetylglucosaminidase domain-containing protein n=1 Tax=Kitasatospora sp. NPDC096147 TaxID=3364093 RepID=UPI0037F63F87
MQARVSVAAGRMLRQQIEQSAALRDVLYHPAALAARRATARTARQLAPKAADRLIADIKGTAPLLASVRAERRQPPGPRRAALRVAATLSAAAVVGGLLVAAPGTASAEPSPGRPVSTAARTPVGDLANPQVYPRPQQLIPGGQPVAVPAAVQLVVAEKADRPAVDLLRELLFAAGATEVTPLPGPPERTAPGSLTVYVGGPAELAGGAADRALRELAAAAGRKDTEGLSFDGLPPGGYLLTVGQVPGEGGPRGTVVLGGADQDGTFHAVQSLRQLLAPAPGGTGFAFPGVAVRDWPSGAPVRGIAESFHGTAWTTDQRIEQIGFLGRTKQNFYLYAPGGDRYRLSRWRDPYPAQEAEDLRRVAEAARQNHVTLGYSIDPGQSFCYSSGKDVDALLAKLAGLRELGFEAFQLEFLDVSFDEWHCGTDRRGFGTGPEAAAKAQAALVGKVRERLTKGKLPLTVVPTDYQKAAVSPYRRALTAALPQDVQVAWSGGAVIPAKVSGAATAEAARAAGRPLVTLDGYPANDSAPERLFLGAYQGREAGVASGSAVLLTAAMEQPVASRVPLATAADFGWNPGGYQPAESWRAALRPLAGTPEGLAALTALAGHSSSSVLAKGESGYLTPLAERFWAALEPSGGAAPDPARLTEAAGPLRDAFATMAGARRALAAEQVGVEADAWLAELSGYGRAGLAAVDMLLAQRGGDGAAAWQHRVALRGERELLGQAGVTVGAGVLDAFLDRAVRAADSWSGVTTGPLSATSTLGTAHDHRPSLMTDDSPDTFYWTSAPPQTGDTIGLDLGPGRPVGTVTVLMGSRGEGPDASSAAGDFLREGVLEYTTGEGGWRPLADLNGRQDLTVTVPAGVVAKAVRLRATAGQKTAVAVRDFRVTAPDETPATVTGGPLAEPGSSADAVLDGNADTAFRAATAPEAGDAPLTVELGAARPLDRVTVLTDPTVRATGTVELAQPDGSWVQVGTVGPGWNELAAGGRQVTAIRLNWAPGGEPPVVNQIVPWYQDTPAARLSLSVPVLDVIAGAATPAQAGAVLESGRPEVVTGQLTTEVPAVAQGLTVAPVPDPSVPRGGRIGVPLQVAAAAGTPTGTYQVPVVFTAGGVTVRQTLAVRVVPPTGGPDLARRSTATASGEDSAKTPATAVNDGDPKTRWSAPAQDDAWVRLELPEPVRLGSAVLSWESAHASAYRLETSPDGVAWTTVATVADGRGGTETVRFDAPDTRYLRVQGVSRATKYGYALSSVQLYGVSAPTP